MGGGLIPGATGGRGGAGSKLGRCGSSSGRELGTSPATAGAGARAVAGGKAKDEAGVAGSGTAADVGASPGTARAGASSTCVEASRSRYSDVVRRPATSAWVRGVQAFPCACSGSHRKHQVDIYM